MNEKLFNFKVEKINDHDIKVEGEIESDNPMNMSTRIYLHPSSIPEFITALQSVTPELIADNTHKPIKNDFDDIGFAIESFENGDLLTIANNHLMSNGTIDKYGLLDIPYIFKGIPNKVYIDAICNKLNSFIK